MKAEKPIHTYLHMNKPALTMFGIGLILEAAYFGPYLHQRHVRNNLAPNAVYVSANFPFPAKNADINGDGKYESILTTSDVVTGRADTLFVQMEKGRPVCKYRNIHNNTLEDKIRANVQAPKQKKSETII